jgi:2-dehydropantoate 2-reductase
MPDVHEDHAARMPASLDFVAAAAVPLAALTAVTLQPVGELRSDPRLVAGVEEACAVAAADGAHTTSADQWAIINALPETLTTSAARDVAAGRPSELDAITGAVVRAGHRLGVPTPTLEELLAFPQPVERLTRSS